MSIKDWGTTLRSLVNRKRVNTTEAPSEQQLRDTFDKAERFDKLVDLPAWEDVCRFMISEVQKDIGEATTCPDQPTRQVTLVIRWNAKRELVDNVMAYIEDVRKYRDELTEQYRTAVKENQRG